MNTSPPSPTSPGPGTTSRSGQAALAVVAVFLLGLLVVRGYGERATRPTDHLAAASSHRIDLNTVDKPELLQVPGIGPNLADAILTHRRDRGRFTSVDDLTAVKGVGGKTVEKLRPWLTVAEAAEPPEPAVERLERKPVARAAPPSRSGKLQPGDPPLDVNAASEADLQRLPGVGPALARRIIETRERGSFRSPDDLRRVKGIGVKTLESLRPYVVVK